MNKLFLSVCAVVLIAVCLCVGGVFGAFFYYMQATESKTANVSTTLEAFFTQEMKTLMNFIDGTTPHGMNTQSISDRDGVMFAYVSRSPYRTSYGYFGSMDTTIISGTTRTVGSHFYADESVSVVMRYVVTESTETETKNVAYVYIARSQDVNAANIGDTIAVFRVAYESDEATSSYLLRTDKDGKPVIERGTSTVTTYEGQTPETKSFGVHSNTEIFVKDV